MAELLPKLPPVCPNRVKASECGFNDVWQNNACFTCPSGKIANKGANTCDTFGRNIRPNVPFLV